MLRTRIAQTPFVFIRWIQYKGERCPSTTRWYALVFYAFRIFPALASTAILCRDVSRYRVIIDLLNPPLQKVHVPFDACLTIYFLLP